MADRGGGQRLVGGVFTLVQLDVAERGLVVIGRRELVESLHALAFVGDQEPGAVRPEITGARHKIFLGDGILDHKEAIARDGQVGFHTGLLDGALGEIILDARHLNAIAQLHAGHAADHAGVWRGRAQRLRERVGKVNPRRLVGDGVDVGEVVTNGIQGRLELLDAQDAGV